MEFWFSLLQLKANVENDLYVDSYLKILCPKNETFLWSKNNKSIVIVSLSCILKVDSKNGRISQVMLITNFYRIWEHKLLLCTCFIWLFSILTWPDLTLLEQRVLIFILLVVEWTFLMISSLIFFVQLGFFCLIYIM